MDPVVSSPFLGTAPGPVSLEDRRQTWARTPQARGCTVTRRIFPSPLLSVVTSGLPRSVRWTIRRSFGGIGSRMIGPPRACDLPSDSLGQPDQRLFAPGAVALDVDHHAGPGLRGDGWR